jgi:exonuclease III
MKILAWNCRGLARNPTIRVLRALIRCHRPDLLFLSETMVSSSRFQAVLFGLGFSSWLEVPPIGSQGGIFLTWKVGVDVEPVRLDKRCISCVVYSGPSVCPWLVSCIYAPASPSGRHEFWPFLFELGNSFGGPWLLMGDFNSVLSPAEKSGGRSFGSSSQGDFADFVQFNALVDLGFFGNKFTWSNHRPGRANIRERLDRGLANQQWVHLFPNIVINHLTTSQSDHCPILLSTEGSYQNIPKPFRFEAFWTRDKSSFSVVAEAWLADIEGSPAFSLSRKWKNTKNALKSWNHQHFGNIQANIKKLMTEISAIQSCPHSSSNSDREVILQRNLQEHLLREEVLWKQKSRELWLTCTDLNTKFFHASTVCRRRYNSISCLTSSDGNPIRGRENIGAYLVDHFSKIFSTSHPPLTDNLPSLVTEVISVEENVRICTIPDEHEIFVAIKELGLNKAPGPDGMTGLFYKTYWPIVKDSVVKSVQSFFKGGFLLKEFNHTNIALIPKVDNPSRVNHFHPISLTNFNYKIISKILSNRFKPLLKKIVSPSQSAFLKGRSIHDNTILAHELFHSMKQKKGNGALMALKLDMEKAFDSMEWNFLLRILTLLGFHPIWVQWIRQCITTSSFSILLDGAPFGKFFPSRGLRQGDPLSPFLFILGSEVLSRLLYHEEALGNLHGIKMARSCPSISHLFFADDVMIFSRANDSEARSILNCLTTYSKWSGQVINISKSAMFFSRNCRSEKKISIKGILNLNLIPARAKYLGIPLFLLKNKSNSFIELKDRIFSKITGWKARLLSQAARTTLVKSVANAIPTYIMSIFLLPKSFCEVINSGLRKFWWGFPQEKKHNLSLLAWNNICQPKALGGLGLRSMEFLNNSLLARLGWKLTSNQPLLWVDALRGKYLKNGVSFLNASPNPVSSWIWKGLLKNRSVVQKGACIAISSGVNVEVWQSPWIPLNPNFKPIPNANLVSLPAFNVADLILGDGCSWNVSLLADLFDPSTVQKHP